jgi:hypothetical protein
MPEWFSAKASRLNVVPLGQLMLKSSNSRYLWAELDASGSAENIMNSRFGLEHRRSYLILWNISIGIVGDFIDERFALVDLVLDSSLTEQGTEEITHLGDSITSQHENRKPSRFGFTQWLRSLPVVIL